MPLFTSDGTLSDVFSVTLNNLGTTGIALTATDTTPGEANPSAGTIDNTKYSYTLLATPAAPLANVGLCNVKIDYTLP
jgi:hypothetical protein